MVEKNYAEVQCIYDNPKFAPTDGKSIPQLDFPHNNPFAWSPLMVGLSFILLGMNCYLLFESRRKKKWIKEPMSSQMQWVQTYCYLSLDMVSWC